MTKDESGFYERIIDTLSKNDCSEKTRRIHELILCIREERPLMSEDKIDALWDLAVEKLTDSDAGRDLNLITMALTGCSGREYPILTDHSYYSDANKEWIEQYHTVRWEILKRSGAVEKAEVPINFESGDTFIGNMETRRTGDVILTDRRVLVVGTYIPPPMDTMTEYRLLYKDMEGRPYLALIDYIWLDRIRDVEAKWGMFTKELRFTYHTKYIKQKKSTLHGPYLFKFEWDSVRAEEGDIDVVVKLHELVTPRKEREARLAGQIKEQIEGLG